MWAIIGAMSGYQLFTRPGCHLCNDALALCQAAGVHPRPVDISDDLGLLRAYGDRIPVLRDAHTGAELGWPFDRAALEGFISGRG